MFLLRHQGNKGWWNGEASRECSHISRHVLVVNCHSNTSSEIKSISCQVTFQEKYRVLFCDMMSLTISAHSQPFLLSWPLVCLVWFKLPSVACKLSVTSNLVLVVAQIQAWTVSVWCLNGSSYALTVPLVQKNEIYRGQINVSTSPPRATVNGCQPYLHTLGENDFARTIETPLVKNSLQEQTQQNRKKKNYLEEKAQ